MSRTARSLWILNLIVIVLIYVTSCGHAPGGPRDRGVIALGFAGDGPPDASEVYAEQERAIERIGALFPAVEVDVRWMLCGMENAFYYPDDKIIVLCTEMSKHPGAAVGFAAHEMAHAITDQLTDTTGEQDADEVAMLLMVDLGYHEEILETALWFAGRPHQGRTGGEHPPHRYRTWEWTCVEDGADESVWKSVECRALYLGLAVRWSVRLNHNFGPVRLVDESK